MAGKTRNFANGMLFLWHTNFAIQFLWMSSVKLPLTTFWQAISKKRKNRVRLKIWREKP